MSEVSSEYRERTDIAMGTSAVTWVTGEISGLLYSFPHNEFGARIWDQASNALQDRKRFERR